MAGHHDAHLGRAIVHVQTQRDLQPSTAIGGCVTCGAQCRHAADRSAPLAYLARPANGRAGPCRLSIAYVRGSAIHACTAANAGTPRGTTGLLAYSWRAAARRRDCAPRPADRAERRLPDAGSCCAQLKRGVVLCAALEAIVTFAGTAAGLNGRMLLHGGELDPMVLPRTCSISGAEVHECHARQPAEGNACPVSRRSGSVQGEVRWFLG